MTPGTITHKRAIYSSDDLDLTAKNLKQVADAAYGASAGFGRMAKQMTNSFNRGAVHDCVWTWSDGTGSSTSLTGKVNSISINQGQTMTGSDMYVSPSHFYQSMAPTQYQVTVQGSIPPRIGTDIPHAPPPRSFNRYVNASDLLEEFIGFVGAEGVSQGEVLGLPVDLFIKWLVIRACEEDAEVPPVTLQLPPRPAQPRCVGCGRWMRRGTRLPLHGERCASYAFCRRDRQLVAA